MSSVEDMLNEILNTDAGYQMRTERYVSDEERRVYEFIDNMTLEEVANLEKKVKMRKERLEHLREQESKNGW